MENLSDDIILHILKYTKLRLINKKFNKIEKELKILFEKNLKIKPINITYDLVKYQESLISINSIPIKINKTNGSYQIDNIEIFSNFHHLEKNIIRNKSDNRKLNNKRNNLIVTYYLVQNIESEDIRFDYKHLF